MRSVVRAGDRPRWQLTTRPATAFALALASLAAAGVQVALLSSPTTWFQVAVIAFWVVVALAFLGSGLGTQVRAGRAAPAAVPRPVEPAFVPVPVRPARPRRGTDGAGEPTEPVRSGAHGGPEVAAPSPGPRPSATSGTTKSTTTTSTTTSTLAATTATTGTVRNRHAVRAVAMATSASRPIAVPAELVAVADEKPATGPAAADTTAIRDGRVQPAATPERPARAEVPGAGPGPGPERGDEGDAGRRAADGDTGRHGRAARPDPDVVRPARERRVEVDAEVTASIPVARDAVGTRAGKVGPGRGGTGKVGAGKVGAGKVGAGKVGAGSGRHADRAGAAAPDTARPRHGSQVGRGSGAGLERAVARREADGPRRREAGLGEAASGSPVETTAPFGGGLTFGGLSPALRAGESWAPAPREPVSSSFAREPAAGRHAALVTAPPADLPRRSAPRHAESAATPRRLPT